jgi:uncharacterized protein YkwD
LRKLGATLLAIPVLVLVYAAVLGRAGMARLSAALGAAVIIAMVVLAGLPPASSNAVPTSAKPAPVAAHVLSTVGTGHGLTEPFTIEFGAKMDASTVAAALRLQPEAAVNFTWDAGGRVLTVSPVTQWQADTLYTLTVSKAARSADGGPLTDAVTTAALTAKAGTAKIAATRTTAGRARLDTAFRIKLDRPAPLAAVQAALSVAPALKGTVTAGKAPNEFLFTPAAHLAVNTTYRVTLDGLEDATGVAFGEVAALVVRSSGAAQVVRFRPRSGQADIARNSSISVRFSQAMNPAKTALAFRVTAAGKPVKGKITWAESGKVLVFDPASNLPYGAKVVATVAASAVAKGGAPVADAAAGTFTVEKKPKPAPKKTHTTKKRGHTVKIPRSGGGGAVSGSWSGVESYYLRLMNCTRTGGWVTKEGKCKNAGSRRVSGLSLNSSISARVSRPYAKLLATRGLCDHFVGGTPGDRLRRAGYRSYRWGENLGCRSGNPYSAVLGSHLYFQSEKPYNGGHYRNLMDARFHQAGIGVWVSRGRVRLVVDFYTP